MIQRHNAPMASSEQVIDIKMQRSFGKPQMTSSIV